MKQFYRLMLGKGSKHAETCFAGGFVGADYGIDEDLTGKMPDDWREFNRAYIPVYLERHPGKSKIGAGLACGALWSVAKGIHRGAMLLCPDGSGSYRVAEVSGDYAHCPGEVLPHRRAVVWLRQTIERDDMSAALRGATRSAGTLCDLSKHQAEIERLIGGVQPPIVVTDETIEDVYTFAMEKHLEEFLVQNWGQTLLGQDFDVFQEEGELVGQQYPTDTGPIDVLAVSKDRTRLLVVELKRGRASDAVVGQVLRYMGFVQNELAETGQTVEGAVIALEDDVRLKRALAMVPSVSFYRYAVSFRLMHG